MGNQKGFASLFGICVLAVFSMLAMAAYTMVHREMKETAHFMSVAAMQLEAQNGILAAEAVLKGHPETAEKLTSNRSSRIWSGKDNDSGLSCLVYARRQGERIYLMAESGNGKEKTRIYAQAVKRDTQGYKIERWGALQ